MYFLENTQKGVTLLMANKRYILPLIPLRGLTIFPGMVMHFDVGRKKSIAALERAMAGDQMIFLSYQRDMLIENPQKADLSKIGVIAEVKQILRLPNGNIRVLVEGLFRAEISRFFHNDGFIRVTAAKKDEKQCEDKLQEQVLMRRIQHLLEEYFSVYERVSPETISSLVSVESAGELADIAATNFPLKPNEKETILEETDVQLRMEKVIAMIENETKILEVEQGVMSKLQRTLDKNQRDYILREQMKIIQEELGDFESGQKEADGYRAKMRGRKLPKEVSEKDV